MLPNTKKNYIKEEDKILLRQAVIDVLQNYNNLDGEVFRGTGDYTKVSAICNSLSEKQQQTIQIPIVNLKLLTALSKEEPDDMVWSLNKTELKQQLEYALQNHQQQLLKVLLKRKSQLENPQTLFSAAILQAIDVASMRQLLLAEIPVNPEGLGILLARNERYLFEPYLNAILTNTGQTLESPELFENIGNLRRIEVLLAVGKNACIKRNWPASISKEQMQDALFMAIITGNLEMVDFIRDKFTQVKIPIDKEALCGLVDAAVEQENQAQMAALNRVGVSLYSSGFVLSTAFNPEAFRKRAGILYRTSRDSANTALLQTGVDVLTSMQREIVFKLILRAKNKTITDAIINKIPNQFQEFINLQLTKSVSENSSNSLRELNTGVSCFSDSYITHWLDKASLEDKQTLLSIALQSKRYGLAKIALVFLQTVPEYIKCMKSRRRDLWQDLLNEGNELAATLLMSSFAEEYTEEKDYKFLLQKGALRALAKLIHSGAYKTEFSETFVREMFSKAWGAQHPQLIPMLLNHYYSQSGFMFTISVTELCQQLITKGQTAVLRDITNPGFLAAVNFNELYQYACETRQIEALDLVLKNGIELDMEQQRKGLKHLFKDKNYDEIMDWIYRSGSSHLYQLIVKLQYPNPRTSLLDSIKYPLEDPLFQKTQMYLHMLERNLKENGNTHYAQKILATDEDVETPSSEIIEFLIKNQQYERTLELITTKYNIEKLCAAALENKQWVAVALILEQANTEEFSEALIEQLKVEKKSIAQAYIQLKQDLAQEKDVRETLFLLYLAPLGESLLAELTLNFKADIYKTLVEIEHEMLAAGKNLHGKIFRYQFANESFEQALKTLADDFSRLIHRIEEAGISLEQPLSDARALDSIVRIKSTLAANDISSAYYLDSGHAELLERVAANPRLKTITELEQQLYALLRQNGHEQPFNQWPERQQQDLTALMDKMNIALQAQGLTKNFLIPQLAVFMEVYQNPEKTTQLNPPKNLQLKDTSTNKKTASTKFIDQEKLAITQILKDFEGKIKTIGKHHTKAKKCAGDLLLELKAKLKEYLKNERTPKTTHNFTGQCQISIHQSFKVLQRDLGWGDYLLNLLKAIVRAIQYVVPLGNENGFFKKKTVGVEAAEKLEMGLLHFSKSQDKNIC